GFENRPPMLNKENYNSIINGPYVRRMIPEPGDPNRKVPMNETFHVQTDDELNKKELKQIEADDQAIQTILLGNDNQNPNGNGNLVAARAEGNATEHNGNQIRCYNCRGVGYFARNCIVRPKRRDAAYLQTQLLIAQKEEAGIQLQAEEFDLMAATADLDKIEEVNENCILIANMQQASTSGTQTDKAPVHDSDESAEVHNYEDCYDNEIFNLFTQEKQYTELLKPILEPHQMAKSREELYFSNTSKTANVSKPISLPNEEFSDDTTPSVARKFLNEVFDQKDTTRGTSANTKFAEQSILGKQPKVGETHALSKPVTSNSIPTPQGSKVVKNDKKQKANVSINEHQKKQKPKVKKTKKVGSIERHASPKPSKPRSLLRWSPTGRMFDLNGKRIASSESESQSDYSKGDNACELDLLFEAMYNDFIGGQPSSALRIVLAAHVHQVRQVPTISTSIAVTAPTPTNSSSQATNFPNTSQDVDELNSQQQQQQAQQ
nr:hypothetical protein [Tanacetum cinerariifolium]